ncbi:kinase-like domain-containing protein [Gigaspora rosea]|uniref:Kinase-like domain-containing protein n=1 Tax=Gigaspora rosea TaxID=44941 RepID=A0A397UAH6_9GLOM|nr:kinase-like domain-containing protein [Gigaspora rosea]
MNDVVESGGSSEKKFLGGMDFVVGFLKPGGAILLADGKDRRLNNNGYCNLVLQYAEDGTLREYLQANFTRLQWNVLIHQRQPKIADFGLSKQISKISSSSGSVIYGMLAYIEPKNFIDQKYKRDKKSNVYSLGVILWEISSGRPPFSSFE